MYYRLIVVSQGVSQKEDLHGAAGVEGGSMDSDRCHAHAAISSS